MCSSDLMISVDGGGTVCGSGGNVRVATGKGVDRDSGNLVMATAAAGSDTGASGAVALKTGSTSVRWLRVKGSCYYFH